MAMPPEAPLVARRLSGAGRGTDLTKSCADAPNHACRPPCARRRAGMVYVTVMRGPLIRIGVAMLLFGGATRAVAQESGGTAVRAADARVYSAALGSYGVQIGLALPGKRVRPFILVGYERLGTYLYDAEGLRGGGRTQQALNLEVGGRIADLKGMELRVGVRGSLGIGESTAYPAGPPFQFCAVA